MRGIPYNKEKHLAKCLSIWTDVGWLEKGEEKLVERLFDSSDALVGEHDGEAVALSFAHSGTLRHASHHQDLPFCAISAVTVAYHVRKLGFAGTLTAELLARGAERGEAFAGLGMFEQGFYDRLGFANFPYTRISEFRPSDLKLSGSFSSEPVRLSKKNWADIHRCRISRLRWHGSINLPAAITRADMEVNKRTFAIGFRDTDGELTHHYVVRSVKGEHGPMSIAWMAFRTPKQFQDILLSIKSFGDQIDLVRMQEPTGIQFQSLQQRPISSGRRSSDSPHSKVGIRTGCWSQGRILDVEACINGMECTGAQYNFNLILTDPIGEYLDPSFKWRGCGGEYTIELSESSNTQKGLTANLPVMKCSVNTFSKLWTGTAKPSMLPYTDNIEAPSSLLEELDKTLVLPEPSFDWDF
ncbi:MAG: GNAT family N-acetyltransferase [Candidatus Sabulitectum sp.]|nr:GNAT family N-acetyltransferase [Candidatus Sabulitectum sp.]